MGFNAPDQATMERYRDQATRKSPSSSTSSPTGIIQFGSRNLSPCIILLRLLLPCLFLPISYLVEPRADQSEAHKDHWANNGGSPNPDSYFPGFEAGWNAAVQALSDGQELPDAEAQGKNDDEWEWKHGFKQGVKDAQQAGSN